MSKQKPHVESDNDTESSLDFISATETCAVIGGRGRPINKATLYRGIAAKIYPRPVMVSPNVARWLRGEIEAALRKRIEKSRAA